MQTIQERRAERARWSDERLTAELANAAAGERSSLVELLLDLVEFDHRSLCQKGAYHTLFDYCTRKLGYSSSEAGRRIAVARKSEKHPLMLEMIDRGDLHLSGAAMLAGLLTPENHAEVLRRAKGRTQDEIGRLVAALAPKPAPRDRIRALSAPPEAAGLSSPPAAAPVPAAPAPAAPTPAPSAPAAIPAAIPAVPKPLPAGSATLPAPAAGVPAEPKPREPSEELFLVSFPATRETRELIERAKEVLRHRFPKAELDKIFNLALKTLLARVDRDQRKPRRAVLAPASPKRTRYVPEAVKRESWRRAGGQCVFIAEDGTRCASRAWLEFDHKVPYALGGSSVDSANIRVYCRAHNAWASEQIFGPRPGGKMKPYDTS
ncbi:MAG: hypothetical protein NUW21_02115 [Elusimicrobia bacterium]|nr:hypothetical protein [Elusimicrobiota bacterium]